MMLMILVSDSHFDCKALVSKSHETKIRKNEDLSICSPQIPSRKEPYTPYLVQGGNEQTIQVRVIFAYH